MRGISYPYTWFAHEEEVPEESLEAIADTGANTVRFVLSNGEHGEWGEDPDSAEEVEEIIEICKENDLIAILEIHDCTGYGDEDGYDNDAAHISTAVDYWIDIQDVLKGEEENVIINIANEPFGNGVDPQDYIDDHIEAIQDLRDEGFEHSLIVDGANWGQDWDDVMLENAPEIFEADPEENVIFSIHMYEVYGSSSDVDRYLDEFAEHNLPLIIGEFGPEHNGQDVDEDRIMERAEQDGLGYIGWSWTANSAETEQLDMANDWLGEDLTDWGERIIQGENGIEETSEPATVYTE